MTDNLVWVVDPDPHPGASRHPSRRGKFQRSASPEGAASVNRYYSAVLLIQFTSRQLHRPEHDLQCLTLLIFFLFELFFHLLEPLQDSLSLTGPPLFSIGQA